MHPVIHWRRVEAYRERSEHKLQALPQLAAAPAFWSLYAGAAGVANTMASPPHDRAQERAPVGMPG